MHTPRPDLRGLVDLLGIGIPATSRHLFSRHLALHPVTQLDVWPVSETLASLSKV